MKLAIHFDFDLSMPTGVGRYGIELTRALASMGTVPEVWLDRRQEASWKALGLDSPVRLYGSPRKLMLDALPRLWSRASGIDVAHFPGDSILPVGHGVRRAALIHDLGPFRFPGMKAPEDTAVWQARITDVAGRADCILANSQSTLDDLLETFPAVRPKAWLTPLGVDHFLREGTMDRRAPADGHILAVGIVEPRKNLGRLFEAYAILAARDRHVPPLVIAGHDGYRSDEIRAVPAALGIERMVRFTGYVPGSTLADLYAGASCLVHPALYEGFGFTLPEASSWGLPVAASGRASIVELFSKAAYMFDPEEPESIADGITLCLRQGVTPGQLEERRKLSGTLTWRRCAALTLEAFERTVSGGS